MKKILTVDDSRAIQVFLTACFKKHPEFERHTAMNGKEAIDKILGGDGINYDLVLLDWVMPDMNGPDVLQHLKKNNFENPIIMLTSKNKMEDIQLVLEYGASEYIMKPFTEEILLEKIKYFLD